MKRTPTFDDFWRVYPLKKGKEDAEKKAWNRLTADEKRKAIADKLSERFKVTRA